MSRLLSYQKSIVGPIVNGFNGRIQDKEVARDLRDILDFRRMPLERTEAAHSKLMVWSESTIDRFLPLYFPELSVFEFKCEALSARLFVCENQERFMHLKDPDDATKGRILRLTGSGSIFESLFSRSDVCSKPIPMFLHVADYMIAFMWQSCCSERAGSHINLTKAKGRTDLHDTTFDSLVFNTFNMPNLHEIDFAAIVKEWSANGHMMGRARRRPGRLQWKRNLVRHQLRRRRRRLRPLQHLRLRQLCNSTSKKMWRPFFSRNNQARPPTTSLP